MTIQEAKQAVKEYMEKDDSAWFESLPEPKIKFTEEDEICFYFSSGDCEVGVFKDSGVVAILPT